MNPSFFKFFIASTIFISISIHKISPQTVSTLEYHVTFNCSFNTDFDWLIIGRVYMCTLQNNISVTSENTTVKNVIGNHRIFKDKDDIFAVWFLKKELHFIPQGIKKFFKHLSGLVINRCKLKEIHQSDLEPFDKLREIYLVENDLEVLEEGLFEYNKKLELLWLDGNKIKKIGRNIFDGLEKLRFLNIREKNCTLKKIKYDRSGVIKVIEQMKKKCVKD